MILVVQRVAARTLFAEESMVSDPQPHVWRTIGTVLEPGCGWDEEDGWEETKDECPISEEVAKTKHSGTKAEAGSRAAEERNGSVYCECPC